MNRVMVKYLIDIGLLITFILSFITGIIKFPGFLRFLRTSLIIPMNWISLIHDWSGIILGVLVLAHIMLNWKWIVTMTRLHLGRTKE
ncbi:MAG TPA: DUF4405 domain-containing protein [Methanoregulaceae archaeon]|nr:DUF4405 domain-containing protein [Methanoregulaceae archaeon]